jgi:hypothetical protein
VSSPLREEKKAWLGLASLFVAVRGYAALQGLGFDASPWRGFWHLVDSDLLETRLAESIFYLHSQPPIFNLALGLYAKAFGPAFESAWQVSFLALAALHAFLLVRLGLGLGLSRALAFIVAGLFTVSPAVLLYENFLFYSYPAMVLLSASAFFLERALRGGRRRDFGWFFGCLALLVLTRSLIHPLFLLAAGACCALFARRVHKSARATLLPWACAAAPVLLVLCKNLVLFGSFALSSWGGMSLARVVLDRTPAQERAALIARGTLSPLASVSGFKALERYPIDPSLLLPTGIPLLDRSHKRDGAPNFHHRAFVAISHTLAADAARMMREAPTIYLASIRENLAQAGKSAWTYRPLSAQKRRIGGYVRTYSALLGAVPGLGGTDSALVLLLAGYALLRGRALSDARAGLLVFLACSALYVVFVGALFERSENQRFRFLVDPFLLLLAACALQDVVTRIQARLRARAEG